MISFAAAKSPRGICSLLALALAPVLPTSAWGATADRSPLLPRQTPVHLGKVGAGEGPTSDPSGAYLLFTGEGRITRRNADGQVTVFRQEAGGANGLFYDRQHRLYSCEAANRRVTRTEPDGSITVMADSYHGARFNSPNDLTTDSRGRVYFTDPRYGPREGMEIRDESGVLIEGVYRIDEPGHVTRVLSREIERPNGILISPHDQFLFVADNNNNQVGGARKLWRFELRADGTVNVRSRKLIFDWKNARGPDGLKMDQVGRLYVAAGLNVPNPPYETADKFRGGLYILSPRGALLNFVSIPNDEVTNCTFGDADRKTLYITAGGHLWSLRIDVPGRVTFAE